MLIRAQSAGLVASSAQWAIRAPSRWPWLARQKRHGLTDKEPLGELSFKGIFNSYTAQFECTRNAPCPGSYEPLVRAFGA